MGALITVVATCYYPHRMEAVSKSDKSFWRHKKIKILHHRSVDDDTVMAETSIWVPRKDAKDAGIEASAIVDVTRIRGFTDTAGIHTSWDMHDGEKPRGWGIAYHGKGWHMYHDAPYGLGNRQNPLVPGRDFAHKLSGGWPHGTRIELVDIPDELKGRVRQVMYRGGCFGKKTPSNRVDLFVKKPCQFKGKIQVRLTKPWDGVSSKPVLGAQEALLMLGYQLPKHGADGIWSSDGETAKALWDWADNNKIVFKYPGRLHPRDPEVAYLIRDHARRKKES